MLSGDAGEILEEVRKWMATLNVVQKSSERHTSSDEYWLTAQNLGIDMYRAVTVGHRDHSSRFPARREGHAERDEKHRENCMQVNPPRGGCRRRQRNRSQTGQLVTQSSKA